MNVYGVTDKHHLRYGFASETPIGNHAPQVQNCSFDERLKNVDGFAYWNPIPPAMFDVLDHAIPPKFLAVFEHQGLEWIGRGTVTKHIFS